jgi:hypothetical protein
MLAKAERRFTDIDTITNDFGYCQASGTKTECRHNRMKKPEPRYLGKEPLLSSEEVK